jgi:DNA-binding winged helix-turn-helix (wHTH) protein
MSAPGRLFSRERILAGVWGHSEDPLTNVVDVYIRRLGSKIDEGHATALIHTVRGLGYRLEANAGQGHDLTGSRSYRSGPVKYQPFALSLSKGSPECGL